MNEYINYYISNGFPLFPVKQDKTPLIKAWEKKATCDPQQIAAWSSAKLGGVNFAVATGPAGLLVIDTDRHNEGEDGEESLANFLTEMQQTLPKTFTVQTPSGGLHRYYRLPQGHSVRSKNRFLPAVDIKSSGGYVLAAGDATERGLYAICDPTPIQECPQWFIEVYGRQKEPETGKQKLSYNIHVTPDTPDKVETAIGIIEEWEPAVEGERNDKLFQMARELCKIGISSEKAVELYTEYGIETIGLDPASVEVRATIQSAYATMDDFGSESKEARRQGIRLLEALPPAEGETASIGAKDWKDLEATVIPERRWFIKDWLSADEGYTVLFSGRGGTGKSAIMMDLMRSLATGAPWLGMDVVRGARSLYVGCEDSEEELARRIQKRKDPLIDVPRGTIRLSSRLGCDNVLCKADKFGNLVKGSFFEDLKKEGRDFFGTEGGVLILDTLSDVFAGNENDRSQVSRFVKNLLNRLGRDLGVTIIVLAHPAKGTSSTGQGFSGSTAWEGAFRCRWELNYQKADKVDGLLELVLAKSNSAKPGQKVTLRNRGGLHSVVDETVADDSVKEEVLRIVDEAFKEGNPFGRGARSVRPISAARILDPTTQLPLTTGEIDEAVNMLIAEGAILHSRVNNQRVLQVNDREEKRA